MNQKKYEIDMCSGPLLGKMMIFSLPLMLSGILQLLFNAADMIVVGNYAGHASLAAVGSTSSLINLLINLFMGLSIGANVLVAHFFAAGRDEDVSQTVHTSILLYNFGSAILRAIGDTKRPLYFLLTAGIINILLNLLFVIVFKMDVAGVSLATVISQCVSAVLIIRCLMKCDNSCRFQPSKLKIHSEKVLKILKIGLPAGIQGTIFSISNVLIQSSVNSFGSVAMAGNTACANLEGFVYNAMNAVYQTALTFTSQNMGGKQYDRIKKVAVRCIIMITVVGGVMGYAGLFAGKWLLGIYADEAAVISYGLIRMQIIFSTYFLCGIMDVLVGCLRGLGYSIVPMIVSLMGACGFRVLWIFTIFAANRQLSTLYISYPISWTITACVHLLCLLIILPKVKKKLSL